ncbi:unnamed protein product [Moneuplotes crassus]|uniref:Uncharacterized protein n=1 Tax=Euplotes crassus TaxID=5936 RepID=A0AAD1X823_EUPCR|nr:unnamed protein product [Moneuplotes crassus]
MIIKNHAVADDHIRSADQTPHPAPAQPHHTTSSHLAQPDPVYTQPDPPAAPAQYADPSLAPV